MVKTADVTHVGFTGSREGMSGPQISLVREYLLEICMFPGPKWLHHGDCIGSDERAHHIAKELGYKIKLRPPLDPKYRAFLQDDCDEVDQPWSYHGRNQRIVHATQLLLATPLHAEPMSGGTWYTIEFAKRVKKPVAIFYRDGRIEQYGIERA
jgi:hypothetical protein